MADTYPSERPLSRCVGEGSLVASVGGIAGETKPR